MAVNDQLPVNSADTALPLPGSSIDDEPGFAGYPHVPLAITLLFCGYVVVWYLQVGHRIPALGAIRFEFIYGAILTVIAVVSGIPLRSPLTGFLVVLF